MTSSIDFIVDYPQQPPPIPPQPQYQQQPQQQQVFNPFAVPPTSTFPQQPQIDQNTMAAAAINPFAPVSSYQTPPLQTTAAPVYAQPPPNAPVSTTETQAVPVPQSGQSLGIYDQTPFCK